MMLYIVCWFYLLSVVVLVNILMRVLRIIVFLCWCLWLLRVIFSLDKLVSLKLLGILVGGEVSGILTLKLDVELTGHFNSKNKVD